MPPNFRLQRGINRWGARVIPAIVVGINGYATWVVVVLLAVNNLLRPRSGNPRRTSAGIAIITIHSFLLLLTAVIYFRVIQIVLTNSGYVDKPPTNSPVPHANNDTGLNDNGRQRTEKPEEESSLTLAGPNPSQMTGFLDRTAVLTGRIPPPPGLDQFYLQDAYECDIDGLPRWCSRCRSWKPDRTHHCSEVGRCVYKMDHFCPWAGGIVSETNFKFFIQFCVSACAFCIFIIIVVACFLSKLDNLSDIERVDFIVVIALAALFFLFTFGMAVNSLMFAFLNTTTVDNLARRTRIHTIAVRLSDTELSRGAESWSRFTTITFPLGESYGSSIHRDSPQDTQAAQRHTFAILTSPPGGNPYDLISMWRNFKTVMGNHWWEWFSLFQHSPCHIRRRDQQKFAGRPDPEHLTPKGGSLYEFGPALRRMKEDAGLGEEVAHTLNHEIMN